MPFDIAFEVMENLTTIKNNGYNYSVAGIMITLDRNSRDLIITNYFMPVGLFSFLSIISLVIKPDNVFLKYISVFQPQPNFLILGSGTYGNAGDNVAYHYHSLQRSECSKISWIQFDRNMDGRKYDSHHFGNS